MSRFSFIFLLIILPLELSAQKKALPKHHTLQEWNLSSDFTEEKLMPFDTIFSLCNRYRLADRFSPINATLGNYGLPFYQVNFFDRITDPDKYLYSYFYPLMHVPESAVFMNVQVPFTELAWSFAGPRETSEQTFRVRHSQNVNRFLNFGLIYDIVYSLGQYNYQRAEDKTFTLFSSYKGTRYKMYFSLGINNLPTFENGGIADKTQLGVLQTRDIKVNLGGNNTAKSTLKNRNFLLVNRYTIGKKVVAGDSLEKKPEGLAGLRGIFTHILIWERDTRNYVDNDSSDLYRTRFFFRYRSNDSLYFRALKNTIRFDFATDPSRKFRLGGGVGIRNELFRYSQTVQIKDSTLERVTYNNNGNNVFVGKLFNDIGDKFSWNAEGELYFTGYRIGDFTLKGNIAKSFAFRKGTATWDIFGSVVNRQPSFWMEQWNSNNFRWDNSLKKEFRIDVGTLFSYPARSALLRFNYAIISNYTDFDTLAMPSQHGGLSVAAITVSKDLRAWKFHLATDLILQQSTNPDILSLPLAAVRSAGYFEHLFRFRSTHGQLNTQVGAEVSYNTPYYAYSWMPATGRFYRQEKEKIGNYPFINLFLNIKLMRTRFFLMMDHVNSGLMGKDYFQVPSYPMNIRMFRYGLAWTFYD